MLVLWLVAALLLALWLVSLLGHIGGVLAHGFLLLALVALVAQAVLNWRPAR